MRKKYILVLTAIILCLIFSLTGCGKKTYQAGTFFSIYSGFAPMIGIKADTDKFTMDNVTFDFYCGLYDINNNESLKSQHGLGAGYLNLVFVIYARRAESANFLSAEDIDDYRNIDGWYYIKEISEEEASAEKYGYTSSRIRRKKGMNYSINYNGSEKITIPKDVFDTKNNSFEIRLVGYIIDNDNNILRTARYDGYIDLNYEFLSNDEIKIYYEWAMKIL